MYVILESQLNVGIIGKFLYNTHLNQNAWRQATLSQKNSDVHIMQCRYQAVQCMHVIRKQIMNTEEFYSGRSCLLSKRQNSVMNTTNENYRGREKIFAA